MWQFMGGRGGACPGLDGSSIGEAAGLFLGGTFLMWLIWLIISVELIFLFWHLIGWIKDRHYFEHKDMKRDRDREERR